MLRRALSNLLSNALRHTPADGKVLIEASSDTHEVSIAVENTGPEIAVELLASLFDRFFAATSRGCAGIRQQRPWPADHARHHGRAWRGYIRRLRKRKDALHTCFPRALPRAAIHP